jgi:hypothetical protein
VSLLQPFSSSFALLLLWIHRKKELADLPSPTRLLVISFVVLGFSVAAIAAPAVGRIACVVPYQPGTEEEGIVGEQCATRLGSVLALPQYFLLGSSASLTVR